MFSIKAGKPFTNQFNNKYLRVEFSGRTKEPEIAGNFCHNGIKRKFPSSAELSGHVCEIAQAKTKTTLAKCWRAKNL